MNPAQTHLMPMLFVTMTILTALYGLGDRVADKPLRPSHHTDIMLEQYDSSSQLYH